MTVSARVNCIIQNSVALSKLTRVTNFASIFKRQFNKNVQMVVEATRIIQLTLN